MEIKTIWNYYDYERDFDKEVNEKLSDGWILKNRRAKEDPHTDSLILIAELERDNDNKALSPDPEEEHRRIMLEPDVAYLVEIKRGKSTRDDYVNTALELGMLVMDKWSGKVDAAINELFDISEHHEEETNDEQ